MSYSFTVRGAIIHTVFFLNSFLPLWIVVLVQLILFDTQLNQIQYCIATILLLCVIVIPTILVCLFIKFKENTTGEVKIAVTKNTDITGEYAIYLITYIIAFISGNFFTEKQLVTFGIIFTIFGIIYVKHHLFHINPFISMLGYKFHRVQTDEDNDVNVISQKSSLFNQDIRINQITRGLYIESKTNP